MNPWDFYARAQRNTDWYNITSSGRSAKVYIYDVIGGLFGVEAGDFVRELDALDDDVDEIDLHINSPGGEVFSGIAILNALRNHSARVVATVDGLAASAASFIAMAGDEVVMAQNTQLMIHDPFGLCVGNAGDMRDLAGRLDKMGDNIANIYAGRAGGSEGSWRTLMLAETWYSADEAVAVGLADRVADDGPAASPENTFDLSVFNYAGRAHAPAPTLTDPKPPAASASGSITGRSSVVAFSDEQITDMRQRLGVAEDADEATILAALGEALDERTDPDRPTGGTSAVPDGMTLVESDVLDQLRTAAQAGQDARTQQLREERDRTIEDAVRTGRITPARREHWQSAWDADPEGARQALDGLAPGLVPVSELGSGEQPNNDADDAYTALFGTEQKGA